MNKSQTKTHLLICVILGAGINFGLYRLLSEQTLFTHLVAGAVGATLNYAQTRYENRDKNLPEQVGIVVLTWIVCALAWIPFLLIYVRGIIKGETGQSGIQTQ